MASATGSTTAPEAFTEEEKLAIRAQLERLLANPFFSRSRRFPSFLRYIVNATIDGQAELLKERTIGIEIFGKSADYDTAQDPIVRVTAAEIRKRIAQYYQDPGHENEMRLFLAPGSYVPQFHFPGVGAAAPEGESTAALVWPAPQNAPSAPAGRRVHRFLAATLALLVVALAGAGFFAWRHMQRAGFVEFWGPILNSPDPVLFCVADQTRYTTISLRDAQDPERQVTLKANLTALLIDDLSTIVKIAGVLQSNGTRYSVRGENATNLTDLRYGPSVMVGAFDNAWTLRLLRPLRFHFANNPDMTMFSIVDAGRGNQPRWVIDRRQPIDANYYTDYAIVARFTDATTGRPALIAAGIARGGTMAAGEFLTHADLLNAVRNQRPSSQVDNVEVVLSTQIVDGEPGTPHIEAVYFW